MTKTNMKNIRNIILDKGMLQYRVAELAGVEESRLSKIINGRAKITEDELQRLAGVLNVTVEELKADAS